MQSAMLKASCTSAGEFPRPAEQGVVADPETRFGEPGRRALHSVCVIHEPEHDMQFA